MPSHKAFAGVVGYPVSHSLSPYLHGFWLRQYGIDGAYIRLEVMPEELGNFIRSLPGKEGVRGVNITVPHKEEVMRFLDEITPIAARIGAVNTVIVQEGRLIGTNSDAYGFIQNVKALKPQHWHFANGKAVVLGAGGAARAVVAGLLEEGVPEVVLSNRTEHKAAEIAVSLGGAIRVVPWEMREAELAGANLLVNSTVLGMAGQSPLLLDLCQLPTDALVTDIVYKPLKTPLLEAAEGRGNPVVDGIGMLLHQAVTGFEAWFGVEKPEVSEALRQHVLACGAYASSISSIEQEAFRAFATPSAENAAG